MKRKTSLSILVALMLSMFIGVLSAFAAPGDVTVSLTASDGKAMEKVMAEAEANLGVPKGTGIKVTLKPTTPVDIGTGNKTLISYSNNTLTFNTQAFEYATEDTKKQAMDAFVRALQNSSVTPQGQQAVIDTLSNSNRDVSRMLIPLVMDSTSADIYTAMKWVNPILPVIRVIFGIGTIIISITLIASTIVDLCFIGLPVMRESMQSKADGKGGKVPFVSADAVAVVKEVESSLDSSGGYKNAYVIYFKRRVLTYIILSICILYLVVGELGGLIAWLLSLGDGVVGN